MRGGPASERSAPAARVVVAMSGGVDSSVAAALVLERGCEAVGVTMHLAGSASRCCSLADADDARRVAERLGIRFFVANYRERFEREVKQAFADAYLAGRTPIPCVPCNSRFKFTYLLERARAFGATRVATGHYARVDRDPESGRYRLRCAADASKDQTYFLFELTQAQLGALELPLGDLTKREVRARARALGLGTADKPESQEICFVPGGRYARVVEAVRPDALPGQGEIVDGEGRVLGHHGGVHRFTVGQRRGLGLAASDRLYVTGIDAARNRVRVGAADALLAGGARLERVHWISGQTPSRPVRARVRIRYRHEGAPAVIEPDGAGAVVRFDQPVRALAPGQAAVFYSELDPASPPAGRPRRGGAEWSPIVLGGGWIAGALS